jgi:hypothetical protein
VKKAIALQIELWIEGEDAPGHDFAESTKQAVRDIMATSISIHPELNFEIRRIVETDDSSD